MSCAARCEASLGRGRYSHAAMRASFIALTAAVTIFAAGCGGDDEPKKPTGEEAVVLNSVAAANAAFQKGDYDKTCTHYTLQITVQLIKDTNGKNCRSAWKIIGDTLKVTQKPAIRKAIAEYGPESAVVKGKSATAKFGAPPKILKPLLPNAEGKTMELRKVKGRWLIATLPQFG